MRKAKKICIVTGTRAEYGLLSGLLHELKDDSSVELQIVACAMHLSPEFGETYKIIEEDGFEISSKVEMLLSADTDQSLGKSMGLGIIDFTRVFSELSPDIVVVLGDRFEILSAATSCMSLQIPVAHIHGGESTFGLIDEAIRHAVTKMSHLHFTSTETYKKRVIQLGETPNRVFNTGAPGLDNIAGKQLLTKKELEDFLKMEWNDDQDLILATHHPVTLDVEMGLKEFENLLSVLREKLDEKKAKVIFTMPNADPGGKVILKRIEEFSSEYKDSVRAYQSMGQMRYLSALKLADVVIGNSSSGIIEAPFVGTPTVNIGIRQLGRHKPKTVIDCDSDIESIKTALTKALSNEMINESQKDYGIGDSSKKISKVLKTFDLEKILLKEFHDLP